MARKDNSATASRGNSNFQQADAFLRLEVVDSEGNKHRMPRDIALYLKNHISEQLITAAASGTNEKPVSFSFKGTIHIVDNTPKEDIKF